MSDNESEDLSWSDLDEDFEEEEEEERHEPVHEKSKWLRYRLLGHSGDVWRCVFAPQSCGITMASTSKDHTVRLWDPYLGVCLHTLLGHEDIVLSCSFSARGDRIASSARNGAVLVWDTRSGEKLCAFIGTPDSTSWRCAFSPTTNNMLLTAWGDGLRMYDTDTERLVCEMVDGHRGMVTGIKWSPDGALFASTSADMSVRLWDGETCKCVRLLLGHLDRTWRVDWTPDGELLCSASSDLSCKVWRRSTGSCIHTLADHLQNLWFCDFSPDGTMSRAKFYEVRRPGSLLIFWSHSCVESAFLIGCQIVSNSEGDSAVKLWSVGSGELKFNLLGHEAVLMNSSFSPDSRLLVSASQDFTTRIWSCITGACLLVLRDHRKEVNAATFSPDNVLLCTASSDATLAVYRNPFHVPPLLFLCVEYVRENWEQFKAGAVAVLPDHVLSEYFGVEEGTTSDHSMEKDKDESSLSSAL